MSPRDDDPEDGTDNDLENRYERALKQVLQTVLQESDDNEEGKDPLSGCGVSAEEKKSVVVGDTNAEGQHQCATVELEQQKEQHASKNEQPGSSTRKCQQGASAHFKGSEDGVCTAPRMVRQAGGVGLLHLHLPGAYNVSNPDFQGSDNWLDSSELCVDTASSESESFSLDGDEEQPPMQDIIVQGSLVQDQGDKTVGGVQDEEIGGAQDEEIGGVHDKVRNMCFGELIEGVKVEESTGLSRLPLFVGVAMILALLSVVVILILGLSGVFHQADSNGDELDVFGEETLDDVKAIPSTYSDPSSSNTETSLSTIQQIQQQGYLACGYQEFPGIMYKDEDGKVTGFSAAFCHAVAAALEVEVYFFPKSEPNGAKEYFWARTHNMERQVNNSYAYTTPIIYTGLQMAGDPFWIENCVDSGLSYIGECSDLRVCVDFESAHYKVLEALIPRRYLFPIDLANATVFTGLLEGTCNIVAIESFFLAPSFAKLAGYDKPYSISKTFFSHDPVGFVTASDDPEFSHLVNSVVQALIVAEKRNITKDTAELFPPTTLFGADNQDLFQRVIRKVGNFADVYDFLEVLVPRASLNFVNGGDTGLIYSHPFGDVSLNREAPLGPSLREILNRGTLRCGIRVNRTGFVNQMVGPKHSGMDVDYCRALAASLFSGDYAAVEYIELTSSTDGFQGLADGSLDVLAGAPWSIENDVKEVTTGLGFSFSQPYFYGYSPDEDSLCLATRQDDHDWASFVYWTVGGTFYAEEIGLNRSTSNEMPLVELFGHSLHRMFRNAILAVGSYSDVYNRNMEDIVPRGGRNMLNRDPNSGQHYAITGF